MAAAGVQWCIEGGDVLVVKWWPRRAWGTLVGEVGWGASGWIMFFQPLHTVSNTTNPEILHYIL